MDGDVKKYSVVSFTDVFRFTAGYWRRQPFKLACVVALFGGSAFVEANLPNALSAFLGAIRRHEDAYKIYLLLGIFVGIYFLYLFLRNFAYRTYNFFEVEVFRNLLDDAFAHVHRLSEQFFINSFTGSIISKITRARTRIETFEDQIFIRMLPTAVVLMGSIALLAAHFPALAAVIGLYLVFLLGVSILLVMYVVRPSQLEYAAAQDKTTAHLADTISGIATTRSYAQESREVLAFREATKFLRLRNRRAYLASNTSGMVQSLLLGGMLTLLMGGGTWYFLHGLANVEDMAYLTMAYTILHSYLRELSYNIKDMLTASYDIHAVIELLWQEPSVKDAPAAKTLEIRRGAIEFADITFTYQGKQEPIFENLSLSIRAGERVALVGHSGSGKTSFVRLVQRLYDVQAGSISIDGQDIAYGTQESLRSAIALVPQDPILFHRTLRDNIAYAKPDASMEQVRAAAQQSYIDDFIMGLPQQYETLVGERGVKLSGGERQRVAIARAILADRPILILDEATSSLDSASEKAIQDALHTLISGRTSIMVAHRLSTILDADRILVFDAGRIVEEGDHAELLAKDGIYAGFFKLQSGGFIGDADSTVKRIKVNHLAAAI